MTHGGGTVSRQTTGESAPFVIGLTGPIASGKSTVAELLRQRGAEVIDADGVYRSLLQPGSELWRQIVARFGKAIVESDGEIDRAALGGIVFADPEALVDLDCITHPAVVGEVRTRIAESKAPIVVLEAVKLVQSGLDADVDELWLISADPDTRLRRLMSRSGMDEASARARIAAAPATVPEGVAVSATIDNSGDLTATSAAIDEAWRAAWPQAARRKPKCLTPAEQEHS
jgi:dephospho-CoA kinase